MVLSERLNNLSIMVTRKEEGAIPHYPLHLRFLESKSRPLIKAFHECVSSLVILVMGLHTDNALSFYMRIFYKILKIF